MHSHVNPKNDQPAPLVSDEVYEIIMEVGGAAQCGVMEGGGCGGGVGEAVQE